MCKQIIKHGNKIGFMSRLKLLGANDQTPNVANAVEKRIQTLNDI